MNVRWNVIGVPVSCENLDAYGSSCECLWHRAWLRQWKCVLLMSVYDSVESYVLCW